MVSPGRIISETRETVEYNLERTVRNNADKFKAIMSTLQTVREKMSLCDRSVSSCRLPGITVNKDLSDKTERVVNEESVHMIRLMAEHPY